MIILGDAGINYWLNNADRQLKNDLTDLDIHYFVYMEIMRQDHGRQQIMRRFMWKWWGLSIEKNNIRNLFAKDGEIYDFHGKKVMAIGGAYSVDKYLSAES